MLIFHHGHFENSNYSEQLLDYICLNTTTFIAFAIILYLNYDEDIVLILALIYLLAKLASCLTINVIIRSAALSLCNIYSTLTHQWLFYLFNYILLIILQSDSERRTSSLIILL